MLDCIVDETAEAIRRWPLDAASDTADDAADDDDG